MFTGSLGTCGRTHRRWNTLVKLIPAVTAFLLLHAFSSGTAALTGVEAISNGITAFKEPRSRNAGITLIWMAFILGLLFIGISFLTREIHAVPSEAETVISQLARTVFNGQGLLYLLVIIGTTVILILAANTAFAGFPRLSAMLAQDGFMPRQIDLSRQPPRVFLWHCLSGRHGIHFDHCVPGKCHPLDPTLCHWCISVLYTGTGRHGTALVACREAVPLRGSSVDGKPHARHELRYEKSWLLKMISNGFGALCTAIVMLVFAVTKFRDGAWIVLILTPILISIFLWIHRHYANVATSLSLETLW